MVSLYGLYTKSVDGLQFALLLQFNRFLIMGFTAAPVNTPKRPHKFLTRKEVFVSAAGRRLLLPYPTSTPPIALGSTITYNGVTWTAVQLLPEVGTGDSS